MVVCRLYGYNYMCVSIMHKSKILNASNPKKTCVHISEIMVGRLSGRYGYSNMWGLMNCLTLVINVDYS